MRIDVFTLFPEWFEWFTRQRHVRNALEGGHEVDFVDLRATTPLGAGQVDDTPYGGGAGVVVRGDVVEAALRSRYGGGPADARGGPPGGALAGRGPPFCGEAAGGVARGGRG